MNRRSFLAAALALGGEELVRPWERKRAYSFIREPEWFRVAVPLRIQIDVIEISATTRRLRANWSVETLPDDTRIAPLSRQLNNDIDQDLIDELQRFEQEIESARPRPPGPQKTGAEALLDLKDRLAFAGWNVRGSHE